MEVREENDEGPTEKTGGKEDTADKRVGIDGE
jgi:hypothetical protein